MSNSLNRGPGRPPYAPIYPRTDEWTFEDWCNVNEVQTNRASKRYGKGPKCSMLTLRKSLKRDMNLHDAETGEVTRANPRSTIVLVKGVTADPKSKKGLGRRALVYSLRSKAKAVRKATTVEVPATASDTSIANASDTPIADAYEATKAALLTPAVTITPPIDPVPVETAPESIAAPAPEPVPAAVASELPAIA